MPWICPSMETWAAAMLAMFQTTLADTSRQGRRCW
jgi:hypothetical protein